jgi:hypothetical protein
LPPSANMSASVNCTGSQSFIKLKRDGRGRFAINLFSAGAKILSGGERPGEIPTGQIRTLGAPSRRGLTQGMIRVMASKRLWHFGADCTPSLRPGSTCRSIFQVNLSRPDRTSPEGISTDSRLGSRQPIGFEQRRQWLIELRSTEALTDLLSSLVDCVRRTKVYAQCPLSYRRPPCCMECLEAPENPRSPDAWLCPTASCRQGAEFAERPTLVK